MTISGQANFYTCDIRCPMSIQGTSVCNIQMGSSVYQTITTADTATVSITHTLISTGAAQAITHGSANPLTLSNITIDSTNVPSIGGAGAGNLVLGSVTYLNDDTIAGTITKSFATQLETGSLKIDDADQGALRVNTGAVTSIQGENILFVGKHGNDAQDGRVWENAFLTINAAVTAAAAGDTILVDPGTYTETITHAANNVTVISRGKPQTCIITQANANVINFGTFTGIQYKNFRIECTAATSAINTVQGSTGQCNFKECQLRMTTAANIAAVQQPAIGAITGAGQLIVLFGTHNYAHTGNGGATAQKAAFIVGNGGLVELKYIDNLSINNSGTALASAVGIDLASTGNFEIYDCIINVTDPDATNVVGFAFIGGTGTVQEFYRNSLHVTATANTGYGFFASDTASSSRFIYNHIHVVDTGGLSYSFHIGNTATVASQFDDIISGDGFQLVAGGNFCQANSETDGNLTCACAKPAATESITILNRDNTATAGNAALNIAVGGTTSTGDAYVNYLVTGSNQWSIGLDNSDSDNLKITTGANPSSGTEVMEFNSNTTATFGFTTLTNTKSNSGVDVIVSSVNSDATGAAASHASVGATTQSGSAGDPYLYLNVSGGQDYSFGIDNSSSDSLKITDDVNPSTGNIFWNMTTAGERTMPLQPAFLARHTAAENNVTGNGTLYQVISTTISFDQNIDYNNTTGVLTAPVTGKYQLSSCMELTSIGGANGVFIGIIASSGNLVGETQNAAPNGVSGIQRINVTGLIDMDLGDTAYIAVLVDGIGADTADIAGSSGTFFCGFLSC